MEKKDQEKRIIDVLKTCYDPEIPVDIYELGLIYEIRLNPITPTRADDSTLTEGTEEKALAETPTSAEGWDVEVVMTLTSPSCPVAESLPVEVENKVRTAEGVTAAKVTLTFDPPWEKSMMSEEAQLELGFM